MGRILFAIFLGSIVALAIGGGVGWLAAALYPVTSGDDLLNGFSLGGHVGPVPGPAKAMLAAGWALGTLVGGALAARIGHREIDAHVVAAVIVSTAMAQSYRMVDPGWLIAAGLLLPWICAWAVARLARRRA